jgi:translocation and assembly module TamB
MPLGKRQRKLVLGLCFGLTTILLFLLSLPVWFPWVLRPVALRYGAAFKEYERKGYSHFVLHQVIFTNRNVKFRAGSIEAVIPTLWLWQSTFQETNGLPVLAADHWRLEFLPGGAGSSATRSSVYRSAEQTKRTVVSLKRWIPSATLADGNLRFPDGQVGLPAVGWSNAGLEVTSATVEIPKLQNLMKGISTQSITGLTLKAAFAAPQTWDINIISQTLRLESAVRISTSNSGLEVRSDTIWLSNRLALQVEFGRSGVLPEKATLESQDIHFAGDLLGVREYREISGEIRAKWETPTFVVDVKAKGVPESPGTNFPPFDLELNASGGTNTAIVHSAKISSPWLRGELSRDFRLYFRDKLIREPAAMKVQADLAKLPWLALTGVLDGQAQISPGEEKYPVITFQAGGTEVGNNDLKAAALKAEGSLAWPALQLTHVDATFEDGSIAGVEGKIDFIEKSIISGHFNLNGGLARRWLPSGYSYEDLEVSGVIAGPFKALQHTGHIEVTNFFSPHFQPLRLKADWHGERMNLEHVAMMLAAGDSSIALEGGLASSHSGMRASLGKLVLEKGGQPVLALENATVISFNRNLSGTNHWEARLEPIGLRGTGGEIRAQAAVNWPDSGSATGRVQNVSSAILDSFLKTHPEPIEIMSLNGFGDWTNGPVTFLIDGSVMMRSQKDLPLNGSIHVRGNAQGIAISNLVVSSQTSSVAVAHGFLPVSFNPSLQTNRLNFDTNAQFQLIAATEPQSPFWERVANWTDLALTAPSVKLDLSGTLQEPRGLVQVQAAQIKFRKAKGPAPALDDVDVSLRLDRQRARLSRGQFLLEGQLVSLKGEVPLGESFWTRETKVPNWTNATAQLQIDHAQLGAFTTFFPNLLSPQGELDVKLDLQPGARLQGNVTVRGARTRPLPALGPIRAIDVNLKVHENGAQLESATANIGGAIVTAQGQVDVREMNWQQLEIPPFKLALYGTNVPLARQPESIIRSDLALTLVKTNNAPAVLSGRAHLRDSYYLHDLADLVPGRVASPSRRPPYFSLEPEPLADWRIGVHVTGERFLKIRSTIFNGEVSANLNLQGTLKEPVALGDARIDSGFVRFPFASLKVQQGFVTLSSQDPYRPQLFVTAGAKQYGYDIKMEVSGPADAPVLQFTSTPPLSSEQILLMITAGELPREERSLSTQQRAQTLAIFVGRDLLAKLGFGDDKEQRLTMQSGEQLSEQGRPTYSVEYQLTPRWSLVGEYDRFNAYNAGLKWRIYSK